MEILPWEYANFTKQHSYYIYPWNVFYNDGHWRHDLLNKLFSFCSVTFLEWSREVGHLNGDTICFYFDRVLQDLV